jgi:2-keto-3-deoxy-L-rhamnonate aldolase RhmA
MSKMKIKSLKRKLLNKEQTYGCWITLAHPLIPEILAPAGFDWLTVDMEHTSIELDQLLPLLISIEANDMVPLVRVGEINKNLIKRVMDAGAHGVIVANVSSVEEAESAVSAVKYPPVGTRGVGLYRAQGFGKKFEDYLKWVEEESLVIIQIESIDAVNNIDDIFCVPGIDGYMIGPYDLSGSLNKPGKFDDPEVMEAIETVIQAGKKHNIPAGFHSVSSDPNEAFERQKQGFTFLAFCTDAILLGDHSINTMQHLKGRKT